MDGGHVLRLITEASSACTIAALQQMLHKAQQGEIVGLAFVAVFGERRYITDAVGECERDPGFARMIVRELDERLSDAVEEKRLQQARWTDQRR